MNVPLSRLGAAVSYVFCGFYAKKTERLESPEEGAYALINIGNLQDGQVVPFGHSWIKPAENRRYMIAHEIKNGDLLLTARGTAIKIAIFGSFPFPALISNNLICIRVDKEQCCPEYLKYFLESKTGTKILNEFRVKRKMLVISARAMRDVTIPSLTIKAQREIARKAAISEAKYRGSAEEIFRLRKEEFNRLNLEMGVEIEK